VFNRDRDAVVMASKLCSVTPKLQAKGAGQRGGRVPSRRPSQCVFSNYPCPTLGSTVRARYSSENAYSRVYTLGGAPPSLEVPVVPFALLAGGGRRAALRRGKERPHPANVPRRNEA